MIISVFIPTNFDFVFNFDYEPNVFLSMPWLSFWEKDGL